MWPFKRSAHNVLIASAEQVVRWTDLDDLRETMTVLFFEDADNRRRSYRIVRYGLCKTFSEVPNWIGQVDIWAAGGPLPARAKPVRPDGKPALRVMQGGAA